MESEASTIGESHPSFGCGQAWFMFAKQSNGTVSRLLLVEAKTPWAVQTLERIVAKDGRAAPDCELLTVHRQCPSIGIRSDFVEEVEYTDFVTDHVELSRLLTDSLSIHAFQQSLTDSDREALAVHLDNSSLPMEEVDTGVYEDVTAAMMDLGFKRPQVKRILESIGSAAAGMSMEQLLREALRKSQAVAA